MQSYLIACNLELESILKSFSVKAGYFFTNATNQPILFKSILLKVLYKDHIHQIFTILVNTKIRKSLNTKIKNSQ